jgi:hypothetical protein
MTTQFAAGRSSLLAPAVYNTGAGGVMGGGNTYYFWLQARNRIGYSFASTPFSLVVPDNCSLGVVIPNLSYLDSEDWHEFLVYTSTTNDFTTSRLVGVYKALQSDQITRTTLGSDTPLSTDPKQLVFTLDNQINFSSTVANPAALPATPINGARRFVTSLSRLYRYDASSTATADGDTVLTATTGRWLYSPSTNLIENPTNLRTDINGCNQNINLADESLDLIYAVYDVSGNTGTPIRYYLKSASNTTVPKGTRITLSVRVDNVDRTDDFSGLLDITVEGKVSTSNYSLSTTNMPSAGSVVPYDHFARNILLEDDLPPDTYLLLTVTPRFAATDLDTSLTPSVGLSIYPYFDSNTSSYNESNLAVGDLIFADSNRRLVVPFGVGVLRVLEGSGCINLYTFRNAGVEDLTVVTSNTANQTVRIARTGVTTIGTATTTQPRRASFSTVSRYTKPSAFSTPTTLTAGQAVNYTINIEKNGSSNPINPLYADEALRGIDTQAQLNTDKVQIIINAGGVYKGFTVVIDPTQAVISGTISDWSSGTTLTLETLQARVEGLFRCASTAHTTSGTGGSIPAGAVSVAYSFFYDGTSVSDISHSTDDGCITTEFLQYKDTYNRALYYAEPTPTLTTLKALVYPARSNEQQRKVIANGLSYTYKQTDTRTADGLYVVTPDDLQGRWVHEYFQVDQSQIFTKPQYVLRNTVTPSSVLSVSLSNGNLDFVLTSNMSLTLTDVQDGGCWVLFFEQGGTGGYTVAFTNVDFGIIGTPFLSTAVGALDIVTVIARGSSLYGILGLGFTA